MFTLGKMDSEYWNLLTFLFNDIIGDGSNWCIRKMRTYIGYGNFKDTSGIIWKTYF